MSQPAMKLISFSEPLPIFVVDPERVNIDDLLYARTTPGAIIRGESDAITVLRPLRVGAPVGIEDPTILTLLMGAWEW